MKQEVTLRQAAAAIVTMCRTRPAWTREECIDFAERQLRAAEQRGRKAASESAS